MNRLSDHHKYLLMGKITQTLSGAEVAEVEDLFLKNEEIRELYDELLKQYPEEWLRNGFDHVDAPDYWPQLKEKVSTNAPIVLYREWLKRFSIAAVGIGLILGGWWYFNHSGVKEKNSAVAIIKEKSIQLQLENGEVIDLSEQKGEIITSSGNFRNDKNSLTYSPSGSGTGGTNTVFVPAAMQYSIILNDGSEVYLNSMSQLKFPSVFSGSSREISISGEAYLKIARKSSQPFIVHLPESTVEVLGTEFNINAYDSGIVRVALVNGSINMKSDFHTIRVLPGREAVYRNNDRTIRQNDFDAKRVLGWRHGLYYYDQADLKELSRIIERCFNVRSVIDNPALYKKVFVGVIDTKQPLGSFLDDLKGMSNITTTIDKEGVLHFK